MVKGCLDSAAGSSSGMEGMEASFQDEEVGVKMTARVGKEAPDFEAQAYVDGAFKRVKLSDYHGQWVLLCFYPGDFTFV